MITASEIRMRLRISTEDLDDEIRENIDAARLELSRAGVHEDADDALTDKAVELFCKAQFNYMNKGEQFSQRFAELRNALAVTEKYRSWEDTDA